MSLDATRWAWRQDVRPTQKLVLLSLADRAGENHECHPSIARLEADTGLYRETVMEAITDLESAGLLIVDRQLGKGNRYQLVGVDDRHNQSVKADRSSTENQSGKPVGKNRPEKADQSGKADTTSREKPTTTSREKPTLNLPSEPINESKNKRSGVAAHVARPESVSESVWEDFLALRKAKRAAMTQTALNGFVREAQKAGMALQDVLELCCAKGWQGFEAAWVVPKTTGAAVPIVPGKVFVGGRLVEW